MDSPTASNSDYTAYSPLDSLSRLSKRGRDYGHRVKRSGIDYARGFYPHRAAQAARNTLRRAAQAGNGNGTDSGNALETVQGNADDTARDITPDDESDALSDTASHHSLGSEAPTLVGSGAGLGLGGYPNIAKGEARLHSHTHVPREFARSGSAATLLDPEDQDGEISEKLQEQVRKLHMRQQEARNIDVDDGTNVSIAERICSYGHERANALGTSAHLHYYQLPFPWRENRYIIYNYRFYNSHKKSFLSVVNWYGWHNESTNIWTHLFGAVYMAYIALYKFPATEVYQSDKVPALAKGITFVFLLASIKCLLASTFWHTFNGTSFLGLRRRFACVDYSGITILITASIFSTEFATLYGHSRPMCAFMGTSALLGALGIYLNCSPKFDCPEARPLRIKFFIALVAVGAASFICTARLEGPAFTARLLTPVTNRSLVWYAVGVVFYGSFIPERFRSDVLVDSRIPTQDELSSDIGMITRDKDIHFREQPTHCCGCAGNSAGGLLSRIRGLKTLWWVDYALSSHTLWHFFVVLGAIGHYRAIIEIYTRRWLV